MVGASKILTVSYGTFSCTLEGFDDPFSTMKSIAEYFRDLAADDRYFGAEPPTPDAEMLHRIAEREIKRRVEARIDRDGVVLRQLADADPADVAGVSGVAADTAAAPEPATDVAPEDAVEPAPGIAPEPAPAEAVPPAAVATDAGPEAPEEDLAAKLSRIRAVVASETPAAGSPDADMPADAPQEAEAEAEAAPVQPVRQAPRVISLPLSAFAGIPVAFPGSEAPDDTPGTEDLGDLAALDGASAEDVAAAEVTAGDRTDSPFAGNGSEAVEDGDAYAFDDDEDEDDDLDQFDFVAPEADDEDDDDGDFDAAPAARDEEDDADAFDPAAFAAQFAQKPQPARAALSADERALRHRVVSRDPFADGADGDHIIRHTEEEFADDEASRRRSAIAHLRAAVAATKADKILRRVIGPEARPEEHTEEDPYRDDLAKVVKSRPVSQPGPGAGGSGSEPPLVLVSSLRVDRKSETDAPAEAAEAVQEAAKETEASRDDTMAEDDASGFEDFARKVGAEELPDLLEAAAAYASFVEGAPHFSRPQIMRQVAKIDPSVEMSREAGLRSFGQLLRQGRIHKLKRGQFTIAETTRFHPDANRFAGE